MTDPDAKIRKGSPARRRRALAVLSVIAALVLAAWIFRSRIAETAVRRIARAQGIDLSWSRFEIDGLSHLSIGGLLARRVPDIDVSAASIDVQFDFFLLARGDIAGLERVQARGVIADVGPFPASKDEPTGPAGAIRLPKALPQIELDVERATVHLTPDRRVDVGTGRVRLDARGVDASAVRLAWTDGDVVVEHPLELRAKWARGKFDVEACRWDPRVRVEHVRGDMTRAESGVIDVEVDVSGFEGTGTVALHLEGEVLGARASARDLDAGALLRAYFEHPFGALEARVDLDATVRLPLWTPAAATGSVTLAGTSVRLFDREFEIVDARVTAREHELDVEHLFVSDGPNAAAARGSLPRPPFDACAWLDRTVAWAELEVADLAVLLAEDIGLEGSASVEGDAPVGPLHATAALAGSAVEGLVRANGISLGALLASLGLPPAAFARIDVDGRFLVPLDDARATSVDAQVAATDVEFRGRRAELVSGRVQLDEHALVLQNTVIVQGANTLFVPLAKLPPPPLDPCTLLQHSTAQVRAELRDVPALLGAGAPIGELPPHKLAFRATLIGDTLLVEDGSFTTQSNKIVVKAGRVPLHEGLLPILFDDELDLALDVDLNDIAAATRLLSGDILGDLPIQSGAVAGHVRVRGNPAGPTGQLGLTARDLVVRDIRFDNVDIAARVDEKRIDVDTLDARSSLGTLSASGGYHFASKVFENAQLVVDLADLEQLAPRALPRGALRIQAQADGPLNELDGSITARANDLVWRNLHIEGFVLDARAEKGKIRIARCIARIPGVGVRLAGSAEALDSKATQWRFVLDEMVLRMAEETTSIARRATIDVSPHDFAVRDLLLAGAAGSLAADVSYASGVGCADLRAIGILPRFLLQELEPWLPPDTQLDAELSAQWEPGSLEVVTRGLAQGTGTDSNVPSTATLSWQAQLVRDRVVIDELVLRGDPVTASRALQLDPATATITGSFPFDPFGAELLPDGPLEIHVSVAADEIAVLPLPRAWSTLRGGLKASLDVTGDWADVRGTFALDTGDLALPPLGGFEGFGPGAISTRVEMQDEVRVESFALRIAASADSPAAQLDGSGSIGAPLDVRGWMRRSRNSILDAPLQASLKISGVDLAPAAARLPALRRTGGRLTATVDVSGTLREPRIEGSATLEEGEVRIASELPSIVGVTAAVRFDGARLTIDRFEGEMGGAPFRMSGEMLVFDPSPSVDLAFEGESVLLWRQADVTVRADANLTLKGPIDSLLLSGDLALRDARYSRKFDFLTLPSRARASTGQRGFLLFALHEPPFSNMALDLRVTAATPFVVANNVLNVKLSPDLHLAGTGELPELRGTIAVEPSRVLLPSGTLRVRSGRIEFRLDQPDVPVLDIQAKTLLQGYDIEILVSGPYDNPRIDLSSVPPLPREDLVLLVLTGRPPSTNLSQTGSVAAVDLAVYIARDVAAAWLEGEGEVSDEESLAERIEVIVGAETTKSGVDAVLVRMRIAGRAGERGAGLYLTGERDVYDYYNYGLRLVFTFQ